MGARSGEADKGNMVDTGLSAKIRLCRGDFTLDAAIEAPAGVTALIGASGAGKSSFADTLAGLVRPEAGRIVLGGRVLFDSEAGIDLPPERRHLGYVFQRPCLFPHMSVRQNLRYGLRPGPFAFDEIAELLGLIRFLDQRPQFLSGGEARRVAIGRALQAQPSALLLDEPTAGLDPPRRARLLAYLKRLADELDLPTIVISHQLDDVLQIAGHAALMSGGRIRAAGPLHSVLLSPDFQAFLGPEHRGAALTASSRKAEGGLTAFDVGAASFYSTEAVPPGRTVRLFLRARDIALALERPAQTSVLNILPVRIACVADGTVAETLVTLELEEAPGSRIMAAISMESARRLGVQAGQALFAMVKAVAVSRHEA